MIRIAGTNAKGLVQDALDTLEKALRGGKSETFKTYLRVMGRFSTYSLRNALLIANQRPGARRVAGFQTWRKLGRWVRKGERGIAILAPMARWPKPCQDPARKSSSDIKKAEPGLCDDERLMGFKTAHVFDVSQTDGKPLPGFERVRGDPQERLDGLKRFAAGRGIRVEYSDTLGGAEGMSLGGTVRIRRGQSPAEEFSTLAHEVAHELLHRDNGQATKVVRETEAEAVAFVVCEAAGLENGSAASDYIQLYDGKAETLLASLQRIRGAAVAIIEALGLGAGA